MTSAFEKHGIHHLTVQSLNLYASEPALWVLEELLGYKRVNKLGDSRRKAIEAGINIGLARPHLSVEACTGQARQLFDYVMGPNFRDQHVKIDGLIANALEQMRLYGQPLGKQTQIAAQLDGITIPILGTIDWQFENQLTLSLHSCEWLPGILPESVARQAAVLGSALQGHVTRIKFVRSSPDENGCTKSCFDMPKADVEKHMGVLRHMALRLERFLELSDDAYDLAALVCPDYENPRWIGADRQTARALYGF